MKSYEIPRAVTTPLSLLLRSVLISIFTFVLHVPCFSQNLVPNGGFEEGVDGCPMFFANLDDECANWYSSILTVDGFQPTPDWFHECSESTLLTPPELAWGYRSVFEGGGYAGFGTYDISQPNSQYREVIGVELLEPLDIGEVYLISFRLSTLAENDFFPLIYSNNIGFNFSTHPTYDLDAFPTNTSHFNIDSIVGYTEDWIEVQVEFEADSAYNYFHLGNFYDDQFTQVLNVQEGALGAYYLVDAISITSILSDNESNHFEQNYSLFPNPCNERLILETSHINEKVEFIVFNSEGIMVLVGSFNRENIVQIDTKSLSPGMYFLKLQTPKLVLNERFIKL